MKRIVLYIILTLAAVVFPSRANAQRLLESTQGIEGRVPANAVSESQGISWTQGNCYVFLRFQRGVVDSIDISPIRTGSPKPGIKPDWGLIRQLLPADLNWDAPAEQSFGPNTPDNAYFGHYHYKWNYLNYKVALTVNYHIGNTQYTETGDLDSVYIWVVRTGSNYWGGQSQVVNTGVSSTSPTTTVTTPGTTTTVTTPGAAPIPGTIVNGTRWLSNRGEYYYFFGFGDYTWRGFPPGVEVIANNAYIIIYMAPADANDKSLHNGFYWNWWTYSYSAVKFRILPGKILIVGSDLIFDLY